MSGGQWPVRGGQWPVSSLLVWTKGDNKTRDYLIYFCTLPLPTPLPTDH